jgi:acetyl esterase/lipase
MPIGYLVSTGLMAAAVVSAVARHQPRGSSPFRLTAAIGFLLNWPLAVGLMLAVSTAFTIDQSGVGSPVFWIGLALTVLAWSGLVVLLQRARPTGLLVERALDEGLGAGVGPAARRRHDRGVERIANIRYGPARRRNLLDVYRRRGHQPDGPTLIYLHPGAFYFGNKRFGARRLLSRLAAQGWVCVSANYRLLPAAKFPDPVIDLKRVIAWVREHGHEYGADPTSVFLAGSSAGAHLASLAAFTPNDPVFQPGFEDVDTSVAGAICLYGYYGPVASGPLPSSPLDYVTADAPPCFVAHGDQDGFVIVDDARRFVAQLRATSSNPVVYAELPAAQHGFDMFRSRRFETVIAAVEAFAASVRSRRLPPIPQGAR